MSWISKIYHHLSLCYYIRKYYFEYTESQDHNIDLLRNITTRITECGAVMIKFCQWVTPKLELIYLESGKEDDKPEWLTTLEIYYENCENHGLDYTKSEYNRIFEENVDEIYNFGDIIGSGSIGQVHLVTNKETKNQEVIKILHPNVKDQIIFFRSFIKFLLWFPCIGQKCKELFPFDIFEFIRQFELQTNFNNEANHILFFSEEYKENDFIIIPKLIRISPSILVMSYEPGVPFSGLSISDYQKDKIVNLYHLFIRNNQIITNYNHGDLHPGNWKARIDPKNLNHKLVIYDYGYCWRIPNEVFDEIGTIFVDTFEESDDNIEKSIDNLCKLTYMSILYNKPDKETDYKVRIREHVKQEIRIRGIKTLSVIDSMKATMNLCNRENLLLDPTLIQCYIIFIQGQKLFEQYDLMTSDKDSTTPYEVFRERYLNIYTFCKTYNIFIKYSEYIENKLNKKQVVVTNIFDTIDFNDTNLAQMALKI